jgi:hypothetical protein
MVWLVLEKSFEDLLKFIFPPPPFLMYKVFCYIKLETFDFEDNAMWYIM